MAKPCEYPELERQLREMAVYEQVQFLKRPENWLQGLTLIGAILSLPNDRLALGIFFGGTALGAIISMMRRRIEGRSLWEPSAMRNLATRELPQLALRSLRAGKFQAQVGHEACRALESGARHIQRLTKASYQWRMTSKREWSVFKRLADIANKEFRYALDVCVDPVVYRKAIGPKALEVLHDANANLGQLADEAESFAEMKSEWRDGEVETILSRLRAYREYEESAEKRAGET